MKVWLNRTLTGCVPADEDSAAVLKKIPAGTTFEADVVTRQHRSVKWHRRYWLLMSMLASHVERVEVEPGLVLPIKSAEDAHVAMKYCTGLYDSYVLEGRGFVRLIKSTAFEKMTPDEWADYWTRVLDQAHEKFLPQVSIPEVEAELARLAA